MLRNLVRARAPIYTGGGAVMAAPTDTTMLDAALRYAGIGWHVLPLHTPTPAGCSCRSKACTSIGKHPRTQHGLSDASTDPEKIASWWGMWANANIGIVCGASGIVAIDVDPRHGGDDDWHEVKRKFGKECSQTVSAHTGGGGEHYIFQQPAGCTIGNVSSSDRFVGPLGRGVDVRAVGGYIVVPPSLHASGELYEWYEGESPFDRKPAKIPLPLLEVLDTPARQAEHEPISAADILKGIEEGGRDFALFQLASKLRYADVPIDWAYQLVTEAAARCTPPFPREDARKKVDSAYRRYEPGKGAFVEPDEAEQAAREDKPQTFIDWPVFWQTDHKFEDWLIEPIIPRGRSIALYAPAKAGKSLLMLNICALAATGQRVFDQMRGDPINIVYFDLEMTEGDLAERLENMGFGPESDLSHLFYYLLPSLPPLDTALGGATALAIALKHNADMVVIDTTSRVLKGPENDSDTMRALYHFTGLPLKAAGFTVVRIDHAGKDLEKGQRGTSAKNDDVDLVWQLTAEDEGITLRATHRRQSWVPEVINVTRKEDPLRHETAAFTWPNGTTEAARLLDSLGLATDCMNRDARTALKDAGQKMRNGTLAAALRYRRQMSEKDAGNSSGNAGNEHNDVPPSDANQRGTDRGTAGEQGEQDLAIDGQTPNPFGGWPIGERERKSKRGWAEERDQKEQDGGPDRW